MFSLAIDSSRIPSSIQLEIGRARPLPEDQVARWHSPALGGEGEYIVRGGGSARTAEGWPVTFVRSDRVAAGQPVGERLHAFVVVDEFGVVVVARGDVGTIDAARDALLATVLDARVDHARDVVALAQVWER